LNDILGDWKRKQLFAIIRATHGAPQGIELQIKIPQPDLIREMIQHRQGLRIDGGVVNADCLHADLVKLTIAPLLGPFVTEHGAQVEKLVKRVAGIEFMLDQGRSQALAGKKGFQVVGTSRIQRTTLRCVLPQYMARSARLRRSRRSSASVGKTA